MDRNLTLVLSAIAIAGAAASAMTTLAGLADDGSPLPIVNSDVGRTRVVQPSAVDAGDPGYDDADISAIDGAPQDLAEPYSEDDSDDEEDADDELSVASGATASGSNGFVRRPATPPPTPDTPGAWSNEAAPTVHISS